MHAHTVVDSPLGPIALVERDGALAGLYMDAVARPPAAEVLGECDDDVLPGFRAQLDAYWAGWLRTFDVPLAPVGTPWQLRVWEALRTVPYGGTRTYGELAAQLGKPTASRAVGAANGRNPISIVVPCHRVVGATGLVGYGGGLERKRFLLDLERGAPSLLG